MKALEILKNYLKNMAVACNTNDFQEFATNHGQFITLANSLVYGDNNDITYNTALKSLLEKELELFPKDTAVNRTLEVLKKKLKNPRQVREF
ncbi:MAG: hypothetical protein E7H54_04415 [Clostridium perfringens]|uniref:hypothetical protein n=1 Tax=Clostridium perfringens TaxID=1502 RepID=UPI0024BC2399|nr:hypothetical protein [Clostridium perfringens]MDU8988402.1 hypothetical protein [Clostridium perfringens]